MTQFYFTIEILGPGILRKAQSCHNSHNHPQISIEMLTYKASNIRMGLKKMNPLSYYYPTTIVKISNASDRIWIDTFIPSKMHSRLSHLIPRLPTFKAISHPPIINTHNSYQ